MTAEEICIARIRIHAEEKHIPSTDKVAKIINELRMYDEDKNQERKEK